MKLFKHWMSDFLLAFICSCLGGLIYSIFAGREYNYAFNAMMGVIMGVVVCAMRRRERRLPKSVRRPL